MVSSRTIARLVAHFDGGLGPTGSVIERIWMGEDASDYLPEGGSKSQRVLMGLKALQGGQTAGAGRKELPADANKLWGVATQLADTLVAKGFAQPEDFPELGPAGDSSEATPTPPPAARVAQPDVRSELQSPKAAPTPLPTVDPDGPIFVVHGHDATVRHEAVRVLERGTGREVIVLHEQANRGKTLLEKFEAHAAKAAYAVVLLTADDVGGKAGGPTAARGRQNVIFELGFFFGKLGRDRVAVLLAPGVEEPSDISGLVYIPLDVAGVWKYDLAKELEAALIPVDHTRIP